MRGIHLFFFFVVTVVGTSRRYGILINQVRDDRRNDILFFKSWITAMEELHTPSTHDFTIWKKKKKKIAANAEKESDGGKNKKHCFLLVASPGYGHSTENTPVLVRSPKLSSVAPGQYLDGRPPGNPGCRSRPFILLLIPKVTG